MTHATHVNGWFPAVYMSCMSQNFRLLRVANLSVRNFRIFLLMYPGSVSSGGSLSAFRGGGGHSPVLPTVQSQSLSCCGSISARRPWPCCHESSPIIAAVVRFTPDRHRGGTALCSKTDRANGAATAAGRHWVGWESLAALNSLTMR